MAESLSLARHIFLTGEKQVGKSTLWQRLIARQQLRCAGFETRLLMLEGQRRGFILHGRVDMDPASNDCIVSVRTGPAKAYRCWTYSTKTAWRYFAAAWTAMLLFF